MDQWSEARGRAEQWKVGPSKVGSVREDARLSENSGKHSFLNQALLSPSRMLDKWQLRSRALTP